MGITIVEKSVPQVASYFKCDQFKHFEIPLAALTSLPVKRYFLVKRVVILDTGHHLKSHPTDITVKDKDIKCNKRPTGMERRNCLMWSTRL